MANTAEPLVAANFGKSAHADLAVGAPYTKVGSFSSAGSVHVLYGASAGLSSAGSQTLVMPLGAAAGDHFGDALGAANFGKGSQFDLAIGITGRKGGVFAPGISNAGAVSVLSDRRGLASPQFWNQDSSKVPDQAESDDKFGSALSP